MLFLYKIAIIFVDFFLQKIVFAWMNLFDKKSESFSKLKKGIVGRKNTFEIIQSKRDFSKKLIWFHVASLGEFEQGRPLIEKIKSQHADYQLLLTFFSPSGYEIRKNYSFADIIVYLPLDTPQNAREFYDFAKPDLIFFVKYEFWYHFLSEGQRRNIPIYYIAALFRPNQYFFKWYGAFMQPTLKKITHYFVQNEISKEVLAKINIENTTVVGDPRIDRVSELADLGKEIPTIAHFSKGKKTLIIGSSWKEDEAILFPFINKNSDIKFVIAPHEIDENHLQSIENQCLRKIIRFSKYDNSEADVLLIDNIGMLNMIYRYGKIAYIGGGFGAGIHNTLEPMAFGLPVIFGQNYKKFEEATEMIRQKGAFSIRSTEELEQTMFFLADEKNYQTTSEISHNYILENKGATEKIYESVKKNIN
jgi:3-deoxy-D-manno-octulosonic-acid transferase